MMDQVTMDKVIMAIIIQATAVHPDQLEATAVHQDQPEDFPQNQFDSRHIVDRPFRHQAATQAGVTIPTEVILLVMTRHLAERGKKATP